MKPKTNEKIKDLKNWIKDTEILGIEIEFNTMPNKRRYHISRYHSNAVTNNGFRYFKLEYDASVYGCELITVKMNKDNIDRVLKSVFRFIRNNYTKDTLNFKNAGVHIHYSNARSNVFLTYNKILSFYKNAYSKIGKIDRKLLKHFFRSYAYNNLRSCDFRNHYSGIYVTNNKGIEIRHYNLKYLRDFDKIEDAIITYIELTVNFCRELLTLTAMDNKEIDEMKTFEQMLIKKIKEDNNFNDFCRNNYKNGYGYDEIIEDFLFFENDTHYVNSSYSVYNYVLPYILYKKIEKILYEYELQKKEPNMVCIRSVI